MNSSEGMKAQESVYVWSHTSPVQQAREWRMTKWLTYWNIVNDDDEGRVANGEARNS